LVLLISSDFHSLVIFPMFSYKSLDMLVIAALYFKSCLIILASRLSQRLFVLTESFLIFIGSRFPTSSCL
jgi:hypothetical protein